MAFRSRSIPEIVDPLTINGGEGNDDLDGATRGPRVTLLGGPGNDDLDGRPFRNGLNAVTARGGGGADAIRGNCAKRDQLYGNGGGDQFTAFDGLNDAVNGGSGSDYARVDRNNIDTLTSIERKDTYAGGLCE